MKEAVKKLMKRFDKDYETFINCYVTVEQCIRECYRIALVKNMYEACEFILDETESYFKDFEKEISFIDKVVCKIEDNIFDTLTHTFSCFRHPDLYDIWGQENGFMGTFDTIKVICEEIDNQNK